jgi:hypothetical protein
MSNGRDQHALSTNQWAPERSSFSLGFGNGSEGRVQGELKSFLEANLTRTGRLRMLMEVCVCARNLLSLVFE